MFVKIKILSLFKRLFSQNLKLNFRKQVSSYQILESILKETQKTYVPHCPCVPTGYARRPWQLRGSRAWNCADSGVGPGVLHAERSGLGVPLGD